MRGIVGGGIVIAALLLAGCVGEVITLEAPQVAATEVVPPEQSYVLDAEGNQLAVLRREYRESIGLDEIPSHLIDAVIAAEDRRFRHHAGVDARAILRAAAVNYATGETLQGGSTITQQLVKNLYLPEAPRDMPTKLHEALLAYDLEQEMSKDEILERYLNTVYIGNGAYGVKAAAFTYWRKEPAELDLAESALLAGLIRAPESGNPERAPEVAERRRLQVLEAMVEEGMITADEAERAGAERVEVEPRPPLPEATHRYWVDFVIRTLLADPRFGEDETDRAARLYGGGLRIRTTLDPNVQDAAEAAAQRFLTDDDPEVAIAVVEPDTGRILATVGGRDHDVRQFDLATQGRRQPGSAFKPFVLTAAVAAGYVPESRVDANPGVVRYGSNGRFQVRNFGGARPGTVTLQRAIEASYNGAFARLIVELGVDRTIVAARALGITSELNEDPAIALGGLQHGVTPLEMAAAYGTLANDGERVTVSPIDRIEDADGEVVWRPQRETRRTVDPGVTYVVTEMLRGVVENGTGARARLGDWEVAGKTGTTNDHVDAWFVGYTPNLAAAVWMGYPDERRPMRGVAGEPTVTGGSWPARIWRELMAAVLAGQEPLGFELPVDGSVEVEIDPETGLRAAPWCPGETRRIPRPLVPTETCPSPPPTPSPAPSPTTAPQPAPAPTPTPTPSPTPDANGEEDETGDESADEDVPGDDADDD